MSLLGLFENGGKSGRFTLSLCEQDTPDLSGRVEGF
jgi:hypothetical protein